MAGFSLAKADHLRKAISKKKIEEIELLKNDFLLGAVRKGYSHEIAENVYQQIMKFANYGFNRSHSVAYSLLAYQLAYLKANYPLPFFCSLLNGAIGSESKTSEYIYEAKKRGIIVVAPSVNHSYEKFIMNKDSIIYPLSGIKQIKTMSCLAICEEREKNGKFKDYFDFVARANAIKINKRAIEMLIYAGALDEFCIKRGDMLATLEDTIRYAEIVKIEDKDQISLDTSLATPPTIISNKYSYFQQANHEFEAFGFYFSKHPIEILRTQYDAIYIPIIKISVNQKKIRFLGYVEKTKEHRTKKQEIMLFATVSDESALQDIVIFPNVYRSFHGKITKGTLLDLIVDVDQNHSCIVRMLKIISL